MNCKKLTHAVQHKYVEITTCIDKLQRQFFFVTTKIVDIPITVVNF